MGLDRRISGFLGFVLVCGIGLAETPSQAPSFSSSIWPVMAVRPAPVALPRQQNPHLLDDVLYASIATYRTFDYLSTRRALEGGAHEVMLPQWVVENHGAFIAFEGVATASEVGASIWLIRHGHRRVARAFNSVSVGLGVHTVVHNYTEPLYFAH